MIMNMWLFSFVLLVVVVVGHVHAGHGGPTHQVRGQIEHLFTVQQDLDQIRSFDNAVPKEWQEHYRRRFKSAGMKLWRSDLLASNRLFVNAAVQWAQDHSLAAMEIANVVQRFSVRHVDVPYFSVDDIETLGYDPAAYTPKATTERAHMLVQYLDMLHSVLDPLRNSELDWLAHLHPGTKECDSLLPPYVLTYQDEQNRNINEIYQPMDIAQDSLLDAGRDDFIEACQNGDAICYTGKPYLEDPWLPHRLTLSRSVLMILKLEREYVGQRAGGTTRLPPFLMSEDDRSLYERFPIPSPLIRPEKLHHVLKSISGLERYIAKKIEEEAAEKRTSLLPNFLFEGKAIRRAKLKAIGESIEVYIQQAYFTHRYA